SALLPLLLPFLSLITRPPPTSTLFPYTTLFRSDDHQRSSEFDAGTTFTFRVQRLATTEAETSMDLHDILSRLNTTILEVLFHGRSEEHTSELQSRENLVCRLLLEKKKKKKKKQL